MAHVCAKGFIFLLYHGKGRENNYQKSQTKLRVYSAAFFIVLSHKMNEEIT